MSLVLDAAFALAMPAAIYEAGANGFWVFLAATVAIGGAAAFVSGRAVAETWRPLWQLPLYVLLLGAAVRFLHYSVFQGRLLSLRSFVTDLIVLGAVGIVGHAIARRRQMRTQYSWRR